MRRIVNRYLYRRFVLLSFRDASWYAFVSIILSNFNSIYSKAIYDIQTNSRYYHISLTTISFKNCISYGIIRVIESY